MNHNTWHFILPAITLAVAIPAVMLLMGYPIGLLIIGIGVLLIFVIAFWYEWKQAIDPDLEKIYSGGWKHFVNDSRRDMKLNVLGIMTGFFIGFIIYAVLVRVL